MPEQFLGIWCEPKSFRGSLDSFAFCHELDKKVDTTLMSEV